MATLNPSDAEARLRQLTGWTLEGNAIRKQFVCRDFPDAVAFVGRLAHRNPSVGPSGRDRCCSREPLQE